MLAKRPMSISTTPACSQLLEEAVGSKLLPTPGPTGPLLPQLCVQVPDPLGHAHSTLRSSPHPAPVKSWSCPQPMARGHKRPTPQSARSNIVSVAPSPFLCFFIDPHEETSLYNSLHYSQRKSFPFISQKGPPLFFDLPLINFPYNVLQGCS